jgi:hypothetical protein
MGRQDFPLGKRNVGHEKAAAKSRDGFFPAFFRYRRQVAQPDGDNRP